MYSTNLNPPPPPTYNQATGLGSAYNTQYSTPLQPTQFTQAPLQMGGATSNPAYSGPPPMGGAPFNPALTGQAPVAMNTGGEHPGLSRVEYRKLQRLAIMAVVCFFPLGLCAWFEYKNTLEAYKRGSESEAKSHERSLKMYAYICLTFGLAVFIVLIINPFRIWQLTQDQDHGEEPED